MTAAATLLTQAEYARSRQTRGLPGGSREAVRKAVAEGRIATFGEDKRVYLELADAQWEKNTRARLSPQAAAAPTVAPTPTPAADAAPGGLDFGPGAPAAPAPAPTPAPVVDTGYSSARARREQAEAEAAEINTAKLRGLMLMREDVDRAAFEIGRELRDRLTSCAKRIATEVSSLTTAEACEAVIDREHRIVLDLLVKALREKIGAAPAKARA